MKIPPSLRKTPEAEKKHHHHERRFEHLTPPGRSSHSPRILLAAAAGLLIMGSMLVFRSGGKPLKPTEEEKLSVAQRDLLLMGVALTRFHSHCGRYPSTKEGLKALVSNPEIANWNGPYLVVPRRDPWRDPWGRLYHYSCEAPRATCPAKPWRSGKARDVSAEPSVANIAIPPRGKPRSVLAKEGEKGTVHLFTCGPDGRSGTGDDLVSPHFRLAPTNRVEEALEQWRKRQEATEASGSQP